MPKGRIKYNLKITIAKIDNFMLKKVYGENDVFTAMLIDWQASG